MSRHPSKPVLSHVLWVLLALLPFAAVAKDIPPLTGRIVDQANLLTAEQRQRMEQKLAQFEQQTSDQVVVLTVDSLDGEAIEDYANKVGRSWALGQKGKDNGVLLLVAKQDRKMRMEVGYGLEPVLTDLQTKVIQDEVIVPHFKKEDYGGGIEAGVDAILSTIQGRPFQPAPQPAAEHGESGPDLGFLIFALFILVPFSMNAARSRSWFLYVFLLPVYFFLGNLLNPIVGLVAAGLWAVAFPILRLLLPKSSGLGRRGGGGWFIGPGGWGGGGGGGGWSGGGGGGGFSGGGGSFGGGGSSSSW
jgi:uncharacterized protein